MWEIWRGCWWHSLVYKSDFISLSKKIMGCLLMRPCLEQAWLLWMLLCRKWFKFAVTWVWYRILIAVLRLVLVHHTSHQYHNHWSRMPSLDAFPSSFLILLLLSIPPGLTISCKCHKSSSLTGENLWCIMKVKGTYQRQISFFICSVPWWTAWGTWKDVDWSQVS